MSMTQTNPPYSFTQSSQEHSDSEDRLDTRFHSYFQVLWKRKRILLYCVAFTVGMALFINGTQRPYYKTSLEVILEPKNMEASGAGASSSATIIQDPTFFLTQIRLIEGPLLAERTLKKLEAAENRKPLLSCFGVKAGKPKAPAIFTEKEYHALTNAIRGSLKAYQLERARLLTISAGGYVPAMVKKVADAAAQSYIEINYESRIDSFKQSFSIISKSLAEIREKIKIGELAVQKVNSEIQLLEALKVYGEKHPLVISLKETIEAQVKELNPGNNALQIMDLSQRRDLLPLLSKSHVDLKSLSAVDQDLRILKPILEQEVLTNREMYNSIFKKLQEVELSGGRSVWLDASIVEAAAMPGQPVRPNKKMNFFVGLVMGLFLGLGLAYFLEYLDSSIRTVNDIRHYLKIFPLGMVPFVENSKEGTENLELPVGTRLYWNTSDNSLPLYVSEAYRIIRTNLAFGSIDNPLKLLQVTSAVKGEGKTTTVANLGISLAQTGLKTLVIDADMRRPSLNYILSMIEVEEGLSNLLSTGQSWRDVVVSTAVPNLFFMSAGPVPPNPAELLSSKRFKALLNELSENFDKIIFDSPPVISVADAAILTSCVEGTILVSRAGFVPRHLCLQAKNALESVNGKMIGCVLNGVQSHHQPYYYQQYGYHSYYSEDKNKPANQEWPELERLKALKEPFLDFLSSAWSRFVHLLKWEKPGNNTP